MSPEEFLDYIEEGHLIFSRGKARLAVARRRYRAYTRAYRVTAFLDAFFFSLQPADYHAFKRALKDRDSGIPPVCVPDFDFM